MNVMKRVRPAALPPAGGTWAGWRCCYFCCRAILCWPATPYENPGPAGAAGKQN